MKADGGRETLKKESKKKKMARNILNFVKSINVEIHEAVQTTTRVNPK